MAKPLSADEVATQLGTIEHWTGDTSELTRTVVLASFPAAIAVVDQIAVVAEQLDHHPNIDIRWSTLILVCTTHSAGGVTARDFELAARIEEIIAAAGS